MTYEESIRLISLFKANYPTLNKFEKADIKMWTSLWLSEFGDIPFEVMLMSAKRLCKKSKFAPTISEAEEDLRAILIEAENKLTDDDAAIHHNSLPNDEEFMQSYSAILEQFEVPVIFDYEPQMSEKERLFYEKLRDVLNVHFKSNANSIITLASGGGRLEA